MHFPFTDLLQLQCDWEQLVVIANNMWWKYKIIISVKLLTSEISNIYLNSHNLCFLGTGFSIYLITSLRVIEFWWWTILEVQERAEGITLKQILQIYVLSLEVDSGSGLCLMTGFGISSSEPFEFCYHSTSQKIHKIWFIFFELEKIP
jgi:hypothetical protein